MLKRIYVHNFRCLENFDLQLDSVNLLLGANGSGRTTVFDVLYRLQQFIAGNAKVLTLFPSTDLTRWQTSGVQRFELELQDKSRTYKYALVVEHDDDRRKARVQSEALSLDGKPLFEFNDGQAKLYHDDFTRGPEYPFDWTQSGVGSLPSRPDNKQLTQFRDAVERIIVAAIHPMNMTSENREEHAKLSRNMENFASWYRYLSQEHQGALMGLFEELKAVLPGFNSFKNANAGEAKLLKVLFDPPAGEKKMKPYDFKELSDGQRVLIALYAVLFGLKDEGVTLFLDEPDNFVALREIQPWLTALTDSVGAGVDQAVLISHHPEIIDSLAPDSGRWFERDANGPARVSDRPIAPVAGLNPSESIARGWSA